MIQNVYITQYITSFKAKQIYQKYFRDNRIFTDKFKVDAKDQKTCSDH